MDIDAAGVQALLAQLEQSPAWRDAVAAGTGASGPAGPATDTGTHEGSADAEGAHPRESGLPMPAPASIDGGADAGPATTPTPTSAPSKSVAELLSDLQASSSFLPLPAVSSHNEDIYSPTAPSAALAGPSTLRGPARNDATVIDLTVDHDSLPDASSSNSSQLEVPRTVSFQQALLRIAALAEDPTFLQGISQLRQEQTDTENALWEERLALVKAQEARVKAARTKARLVGPGLTAHDAAQLADALARDRTAFDARRVLPALDGLRARQRVELTRLGIPSVPPEALPKVVQVLEGLLPALGT